MAPTKKTKSRKELDKVRYFIKKGKTGTYRVKKNFINKRRLKSIIKQAQSSRNYLFSFSSGNRFFNVSNTSAQQLIDVLEDDTFDEDEPFGSDEEFIAEIINQDYFEIEKIRKGSKKNKKKRRAGGYFGYLHKLKLNLTKYGLFKYFNKKHYDINCLVRCFIKFNISKSELDLLKDFVKDRNVPFDKLKKVSDKLEINIILYKYNKGESKFRKTKIKSKDDYERTIEIACFEKHYFLYEDVDVSEEPEFKKRRNKMIKTTKLLKYLVDNKERLLTEIPLDVGIYNTPYYDKTTIIKDLEYHPSSTRQMEYREIPEKYDVSNVSTFYFDFEAITDTERHIAYLCCVEKDDGTKKSFVGEKCAKEMLKYIIKEKEKVIMIAHNLMYDFSFIVKYLNNIHKVIKKGSKLMYAIGYYKKTKIILKDSYAMIPKALRDFGKMFNLPQQKEVMPYGAYNKKTIKKEKIKVDYALDMLKTQKERLQMLKNIKDWNLYSKTKKYFNHIEYSRIYCEMDCKVLHLGYEKFRKDINEQLGFDIKNFISQASLAHKYMLKEGVYEPCYMFSGIVREFIQRCLVGGRVMTAKNLQYHVKKILNDFDAVSLYPSAMERIGKNGGYLMGKPKVLKTKDYNTIKNYDGYFIEVEVLELPIKRDFPLASEIDDKGIRDFTNDPKRLYLDKFSLEDLIKFQGLKFKILRGYYFDEGRNNKIKDVIRYVFDKRNYYKSIKNPVQEVYKVIMNSSYGKTIMKPINDDLKFIKGKENLYDFRRRHNNWWKWYEIIDDNENYIIKTRKSISQHFSSPHIGVEILSMSKRIMNEVICLSEDLGLTIYYQDTDSIHITDEHIKILEQKFKELYKRELIGKDMGQFHSDFSLKVEGKKIKNIVAVESIFIGKKTYIDKLRGEDEDGNFHYDFHTRAKGMPLDCLKGYCKDNNMTELELYQKRYKGERFEIDLAKYKFFVENGRNFTLSTKLKFPRTF